MLPREVTSVSFESFRELSKNKKVILLYPWANYRNIFLSYFLNDVQEGLIYYRIPENTDSLAHWVQGLLEEVRYVIPAFGKKLTKALESANPTEMGKALAEDIAKLNIDRSVLYIDELDRVEQDEEFNAFMDTLVSNLPKNAQLAVNSRLLTTDPWIDMVARGEAVVLGTAHRRNNLMFTVEAEPKPQLEIYAFGRGHAVTNGREIKNWDGALPRNLFFYFIDNPLVTRDQIFEVFWPKLSVKDATNVFHVTKRKITERISMKVEDEDNYELTTYSAGFYMPSDKVVRHYDVFDFEEAIEQALITENDHEKEVLFSHAVDIYKAPFLHTISLPWVDARRIQLQEMYAEALIGMGRLTEKRGAWEEALGFYARSLKEAPQREDIHRDAMRMYINLGRNEDAVAQYRTLESYLHKSVNVAPSKESQELFKTIS